MPTFLALLRGCATIPSWVIGNDGTKTRANAGLLASRARSIARDCLVGFALAALQVRVLPPPHRVRHARNNLAQYRRWRREVQPREPRVIRTKGFPKIQPN